MPHSNCLVSDSCGSGNSVVVISLAANLIPVPCFLWCSVSVSIIGALKARDYVPGSAGEPNAAAESMLVHTGSSLSEPLSYSPALVSITLVQTEVL